MPDSDPHALLEIDLDAIASNWRRLCEEHRAPVAAVLKADAYGLGATQVGPRLLAEGCRHFFVAHPGEALALRPLLPGATLAVLNGLWPGEAGALAEAGVLPVLGQLSEIEAWAAEARRRGRPLPAMLHVDTGMNRLGLDAPELDAAVRGARTAAGRRPALRDDAPGHGGGAGRPAQRAPAPPLRRRLRPAAAGAAQRSPTRPACSWAGVPLGPGAAGGGALRHQPRPGRRTPCARCCA